MDETYNGYDDCQFDQDKGGNELRPKQSEFFKWQTYAIVDDDGQYNGEFQFFLSEGKHTITLQMLQEAFAINKIIFYQSFKTSDYATVKKEWDAQGAKDRSGFSQVFQAEKSYIKSSNTLFPTYDNSSVDIQPSDPKHILYTTIGKTTWDSVGEYITWEFSVPEDGYYCFSFKAKQNAKRGMYSARELMIDDQVLFTEMKNLKFENKNSWYMKTFSDSEDNPYKIFLTAGRHTMRLAVSVGDLADIPHLLSDIKRHLIIDRFV
jgi:hypothetical protein